MGSPSQNGSLFYVGNTIATTRLLCVLGGSERESDTQVAVLSLSRSRVTRGAFRSIRTSTGGTIRSYGQIFFPDVTGFV